MQGLRILLAGVILGAFAQQKTPEKIPAYYPSEAAAKPFPQTLDPASFKPPLLRKVYQIARDIPGVLAQQPCYCHCDRLGHKGLLDCHRDYHSAG